jgi:hypothetical protein
VSRRIRTGVIQRCKIVKNATRNGTTGVALIPTPWYVTELREPCAPRFWVDVEPGEIRWQGKRLEVSE